MVLRLWMLALAAFLAVVSAGCGGSSPDPLTKGEFEAQAKAICVSAQKERKSQSQQLVKEDAADAEAAVGQLVEPVEAMTEELGELGPPKGDEKEVEAIISAFEDGNAAVEAEPDGPKTASAYAEANQLATEYGLTDCTV